MPLLMEKEITTNRIILTNYEIFRALDDPIRGKIVQLLHKKQLNVEQICRRLKKFGYKKAVTTIRHHIEILKTRFELKCITSHTLICSDISLSHFRNQASWNRRCNRFFTA